MRDADDLLARISGSADLARLVPRLPAEALHRVVEQQGLADCGGLLALATPEQIAAVFDLDLWRADAPAGDEAFDAERFGEWIEVLNDAGASTAAGKIGAIDPELIVTGLAAYVRVFDAAVLSAEFEPGLHCRIGGYVVVARRTDAWDAMVDLLVALEAEHHARFHRLMAGCRRLSNSAPEVDGCDDLASAAAQVRFDVAVAREDRRAQHGYVSPAQARAFLQSPSRTVFAAYQRETAAIPDLRRPDNVSTRRQLTGSEPQPRAGRLQEQMAIVARTDAEAHASRIEELAFLANALIAGCPLQGRPFTPREAADGAAAVCNLGLDSRAPLPEDWLVRADLIAAFADGWTVLHRDVASVAAGELLAAVQTLQCSDRDTALALHVLRKELTRQLAAGTPWRARDAMEVVGMLDMATWAALCGLIAEFPVMLGNVQRSRTPVRAVDPAAFEWIADLTQVAAIHEFTQTIADLLMP